MLSVVKRNASNYPPGYWLFGSRNILGGLFYTIWSNDHSSDNMAVLRDSIGAVTGIFPKNNFGSQYIEDGINTFMFRCRAFSSVSKLNKFVNIFHHTVLDDPNSVIIYSRV